MIRKIFNYLFTDFHLLTDKMAMDAYKALFVLVIAQMLVWFSFFGLLNTGEELTLMVIGAFSTYWVTQLESMDVFFARPLKYYRVSFLLKYKTNANPNTFISIQIYSRILDIRRVCDKDGHIE